MKKLSKYFTATAIMLIVSFLFISINNPANSNPSEINPDDYPQISDKELGQLIWALNIADQDLDDFTHLEGSDQYGMSAYRYSIAFMTYFMAVEQYHKLPAYSGLIQPRMDRLISKMIRKPVWEFWADVSPGLPMVEPKFNKPYPVDRDPVGKKNIMYSGHLAHMIALYEMLYRDMKWSAERAVVFQWSDDEKFVYNNASLQQVMYDQMKNNPQNAIECEPNLCFPECNQHPVLSFMLYDHVHGTNLSEAGKLFKDFFIKNDMINSQTHQTAAFYMVKQKRVLRAGTMGASSANGWTGAFMHAWAPEVVEKHYEFQKKDNIKKVRNGMATLKKDYIADPLQYGFFGIFAAEMGDYSTRDALIAKADKKYVPVWDNDAYHYPINQKRKSINLTGKLIAVARALPKNGLWDIHNKPFDEKHFGQPRLAEIDLPKVMIRRAIWDAKKKALIITTEPGREKIGNTYIQVTNLDPIKSYQLTIDGVKVKEISRSKTANIEVGLDLRHDIVLIKQ